MREYRFLGFALQPEDRLLRKGDGEAIELTPRLFEALRLFLEHPGELLEKERLLSELWPGLVVEENSLSQTVSALRRALDDDAQQPRFIQTVPRRGFRFVAPVDVVDTPPDPPPPAGVVGEAHAAGGTVPPPAPSVAPTAPSRRLWMTGATGTLLVAAAGTLAWRWHARSDGSAGHGPRTLAVLPFKPVVTGTGDEPLELGMAESLVSRLSSLPGVAVRSAASVRRFRGADQDPSTRRGS